ncbi:hypothetical protein CGRA01v4_00852 [Colletotrichum graminicola]|nr:hypothetical protein CGRA01v4_00852 [Colletotrichum graminicola]
MLVSPGMSRYWYRQEECFCLFEQRRRRLWERGWNQRLASLTARPLSLCPLLISTSWPATSPNRIFPGRKNRIERPNRQLAMAET